MATAKAKESSKIRHVATSYRGPLLAAGEFEHRVHVWDIQSRRKVSEFDTILDFGGVRLAISEDGRRCVAGAYDRYGIVHYDTSGRVMWQRKDLRKLQWTGFSRHSDAVLASFDERPFHRLHIASGETAAT